MDQRASQGQIKQGTPGDYHSPGVPFRVAVVKVVASSIVIIAQPVKEMQEEKEIFLRPSIDAVLHGIRKGTTGIPFCAAGVKNTVQPSW